MDNFDNQDKMSIFPYPYVFLHANRVLTTDDNIRIWGQATPIIYIYISCFRIPTYLPKNTRLEHFFKLPSSCIFLNENPPVWQFFIDHLDKYDLCHCILYRVAGSMVSPG